MVYTSFSLNRANNSSKYFILSVFLLLFLVCSTGYAANPFAIGGGVENSKQVDISELPLEQLTLQAKQDDISACYELANRYYSGKGVVQDLQTAAIWFRKGADLGDPAAQTTLGVMLYKGDGLEQDYKKAMDWFEKASSKKFARAQYNIGLMYLNGEGVEKNDDKAVVWFSKAAENNDGQAQYILACMYIVAQGVNEDYLSAYKWLLLAEYNDVDVKFMKDMVEKSLSEYERQKAILSASEFIEKRNSDKAGEAVSPVDIGSDQPVRGGTGFFITKDGYILTAYHLIRDSENIKVRSQLGIHPVKMVMYDSTNDFALLKLEGYVNCKPLPLADINRKYTLAIPVWTYGYKAGIKVGESAEFINGSISALTGNLIGGEIPQKYEILNAEDQYKQTTAATPNIRFFQVECDAGPGNAGGAVVGSEGDVIGIFASEFDADLKQLEKNKWPVQKHFVIKVSFILPFLDSIPGLELKLDTVRNDRKLEQAAIQAKNATVQVLCY